jgi:hypothetical protein
VTAFPPRATRDIVRWLTKDSIPMMMESGGMTGNGDKMSESLIPHDQRYTIQEWAK